MEENIAHHSVPSSSPPSPEVPHRVRHRGVPHAHQAHPGPSAVLQAPTLYRAPSRLALGAVAAVLGRGSAVAPAVRRRGLELGGNGVGWNGMRKRDGLFSQVVHFPFPFYLRRSRQVIER